MGKRKKQPPAVRCRHCCWEVEYRRSEEKGWLPYDPDGDEHDCYKRREKEGQASLLDFDPHAHYHRDGHTTEREAAFFQGGKAKESCRKILDHLREIYPKGLTDEEGKRELKMFSYRRRRSDLFGAGLVEDSGEKRPSDQDCDMIVWRAVQ